MKEIDDLKEFIDKSILDMTSKCPSYAKDPVVLGYHALKNSSKDYQSYLLKVKQYFDDFCLRQIYFVCAKISIRKYFPEKSYIIEPYKSENMAMKDLDHIIEKLKNTK